MEKLGINTTLLLTQIVNFLIMVLVLQKFLYKPILKMIRERQKKINEGLALAENMAGEKEKLGKEREKIISKADDEARTIIEKAKKEAEEVKSIIIKEGHEDVAVFKERMEKELSLERERMHKQATEQSVEIAQAMVKQVVGDLLTTKTQHQLIQKQLMQLSKAYEKHA